ncbi:MAG: zinc-dependent metalloprotease [Ferruginibacter sp.]
MKLTTKGSLLFAVLLFVSGAVSAQRSNRAATDTATTDTSKSVKPKLVVKGPKPYSEVITAKAKTDDGMFKVHFLDDKYFFEIPKNLLKREILVVNRISKAPSAGRNSGLSYAGDDIGQNVIWFENGPNENVFLRTISYAEYTKDSTSPMFTSVNNSNIQPIEFAFDIKAFSKDSSAIVIDVTDMVNGDNDLFFLNGATKKRANLSAIQKDKSYVVGVKSFPINLEFVTVKTYASSPTAATSGNVTLELNSSLVLLPQSPMQSRYYDSRIGYFNVGYTDFDLNPQGVKRISIIKRWRLEPKEEDMEKYKRGELVEPKKPIIFYIDPATPAKWVPYLIEGVNDWQAAFKKAGFKNAIFAQRAPTKAENPEWSLEDARFSAIVYKPSTIPNASGPSIADPRSGEIMESHINWYHNVMQLIRNWYFVQAAPNDVRARKMVFDDELMGQLIRFVSSHEVGHTLGLRHNFGSSSTVPVEKLRDKAWVEANGHTPSIMDYARFNYVAQPEDNIGPKGIFPRIGDYDDWAIEWGYRRFMEYSSPTAEKASVNKWVMEKMKNKRNWFGDGEGNRDDPRNQSEQVGDDAVKGSLYGIRNLKRIIPNLNEWTKEANEDYSNLEMMYGEVTTQFNRYNNHVLRTIGGIMKTPKVTEEPGVVFETVAKAKQKEAVYYLNQNLFKTPEWLINNDIFAKTGKNGLQVIGDLQEGIISNLFRATTLNHLVQAATFPGAETYTIPEMLTDLKKGVWSELPAHQSIDIYRRQLQQTYIDKMDLLLNPPPVRAAEGLVIGRGGAGLSPDNDFVDVQSSVRAHLTALKSEISIAANTSADQMTKYHLKDMSRRIEKALDPNK